MLLMFFALTVSAQDKIEKEYYVYCEIDVASNGKVFITISSDINREPIYDESGKDLKLKRIEAINYMAKRGWEYVDEVTHTAIEHFLMRKKVKSDSQILEDLNVKSKK